MHFEVDRRQSSGGVTDVSLLGYCRSGDSDRFRLPFVVECSCMGRKNSPIESVAKTRQVQTGFQVG